MAGSKLTGMRVEIFNRAGDFGSGDGQHAVAILVSLLRWSAWTPATFYSQLIISALTCFAQSISPTGPTRASSIWRAFTIGRVRFLSHSRGISAATRSLLSSYRTC